MVAYSFKARFAEPILAGTKDQTIRAVGKRRHANPGQQLQLYTGMRTRQCRLIATAECVFQWPVTLRIERMQSGADGYVRTPNGTLDNERLDAFARRDGFAGFQDMADFWFAVHGDRDSYAIDFEGVLIRWKLKAAT